MLADQSIRAGDNSVVIAGGFENMSAAPHMAHVRAGLKFGDGKPSSITWPTTDLTCAFEEWGMGFAAEHTADKVGISRDDMDAFSARSHQRAAEATEQGWFKDEILPLEAKSIKQKADVTSGRGCPR